MPSEGAQTSPKPWRPSSILDFLLRVYLYWLLTGLSLGGVFVLLMGALALTGGLDGFHSATRDAQICSNNLKQFGLALHNYLATNGSFPPAYTVDADGRKMHSWRALLLPYFEGSNEDTDIKYDFSQPWDSPHNRQFADQMPRVFRCPSNRKDQENVTNYVAVVGVETMWPFDRARSVQEVTDGLSATIAVVEVAGADIPWLEPQDLPFDEMTLRLNSSGGHDPSSRHHGRVHVLMADGRARELSDGTTPAKLRALLTVDGGENVEAKTP